MSAVTTALVVTLTPAKEVPYSFRVNLGNTWSTGKHIGLLWDQGSHWAARGLRGAWQEYATRDDALRGLLFPIFFEESDDADLYVYTAE